jgi:hypothetical protein
VTTGAEIAGKELAVRPEFDPKWGDRGPFTHLGKARCSAEVRSLDGGMYFIWYGERCSRPAIVGRTTCALHDPKRVSFWARKRNWRREIGAQEWPRPLSLDAASDVLRLRQIAGIVETLFGPEPEMPSTEELVEMFRR